MSTGGPAFVWLASGALGLALVVLAGWGGLWQERPARVAWAALLWLFHLGLTFPAALLPSLLEDKPAWAVDWLFTPAGTRAVIESTLFLFCFLAGSELGYRARPASLPFTAPSPELRVAGNLCVGAGIGLLLLGLQRHGLEALLVPYEQFFPAFSLDFSRAVLVVGFGALLVLASGASAANVAWAVAAFVAVASPVFLVGGRSAPMFTTVALVVVAIQRGMLRRRRWLAAAAVVLLSAIAVVRVSREGGVATLVDAAAESSPTPVAGLAELGGSLAPVWAVIDSEARFGREYFWGETYLFPFSRVWGRFTGSGRTDPANDPRFIAELVNREYGSIGFSTVAEAYANGGTAGVVVFALAWGAVLGWLEGGTASPWGRAVLGAVLVPMLFNVRNSFIFVPAWAGTGLAIVGLAYALRSRRLDTDGDGSWLATRRALRAGATRRPRGSGSTPGDEKHGPTPGCP